MTDSTQPGGSGKPDAQERTPGQERHRHFRLNDSVYVWHSHKHTCTGEDFNRLHHHPPQEHAAFTLEELTLDESLNQ